MKRVLVLNLLILNILILFSSCSRKEKDGDWDDNIKLSTKTDLFEATTDSVLITTKGDTWWVSYISVDNAYFYGFEGANQLSESYIIKQDCFVVERRDKNTLFIKLKENDTNNNRIVTIGLQAGDYFDSVTITQKRT